MNRTRWLMVGLYMSFGAAAVAAYLLVHPIALGIAAFAAVGVAGQLVCSALFERFASLDEKQREMEDALNSVE